LYSNQRKVNLHVSGTQRYVDKHLYSKQRQIYLQVSGTQGHVDTHFYTKNREKFTYMLAVYMCMLTRIQLTERR